jgi:hypothetical protein
MSFRSVSTAIRPFPVATASAQQAKPTIPFILGDKIGGFRQTWNLLPQRRIFPLNPDISGS